MSRRNPKYTAKQIAESLTEAGVWNLPNGSPLIHAKFDSEPTSIPDSAWAIVITTDDGARFRVEVVRL